MWTLPPRLGQMATPPPPSLCLCGPEILASILEVSVGESAGVAPGPEQGFETGDTNGVFCDPVERA